MKKKPALHLLLLSLFVITLLQTACEKEHPQPVPDVMREQRHTTIPHEPTNKTTDGEGRTLELPDY